MSTPRSRCRASRVAVALLVGTIAVSVEAQPLPTRAAATAARSTDEALLLEVEINGVRQSEPAIVLRGGDGRLYVDAATLARWRLRAPAVPPMRAAGGDFVPLDAIAGLTARYDAALQRIAVDAPAAAFAATEVVHAMPPMPRPSAPSPGGFVNYDAVASRSAGESTFGATFEGGLFGPLGVVTSSALAQRTPLSRDLIRLDTTWTYDLPDRLETLRAGDVVTIPGTWGRAVRIGGVQWGTNFAIQPGFVAFPSVSAIGQAALPSTVDVYVNNALVAQRPVPPGPFSITNIPTVGGAGNVQLVVRDLLGRETVIAQPFYGATQLLAAGLSDYSVSAGFERANYGLASDDYGRAVATASWRHGITSTLTGEVRGELLRDTAAVGASAGWLVPTLGVLEATVAHSESRDEGGGSLAGVGFSRQTGRASIDARLRYATRGFRVSGDSPDAPAPRREAAVAAGLSLDRYGSIAATYVTQRYDAPMLGDRASTAEFASIAYTVSTPLGGALSVIALRDLAGGSGTTITAVLTLPFGARDSASVLHTSQRGADRASYTQVAAQRSLPVGDGFGYRVQARTGGDWQAGVAWQHAYGRATLEAARFEGSDSARAGIAGGLGFLGGHAFASREITDSFGVVTVDDYDDVGVLLDNQPAARTARGGYAVLPRLRAYDVNRITLDQQDLPLDAELDRLSVPAVPSFRSGVLVRFPVRRSHGATFHVVLDDGGDLPAGATIVIDGEASAFPVGLSGVAYVTGLGARTTLRASWRGQSCTFELVVPPSRDPLPDLGTVACAGVKR